MAVKRKIRGATIGEAEVLYGHLCTISNFEMPQAKKTRWEIRIERGGKLQAEIGLDALVKGARAAGDFQDGGAGRVNFASCAMD